MKISGDNPVDVASQTQQKTSDSLSLYLVKLKRLYAAIKRETSGFTRHMVAARDAFAIFDATMEQDLADCTSLATDRQTRQSESIYQRFGVSSLEQKITQARDHLVEFMLSCLNTVSDAENLDAVFPDPLTHQLPSRDAKFTNHIYLDDVILPLRQKAKDLAGISTLETSIENRYGFTIETENFSELYDRKDSLSERNYYYGRGTIKKLLWNLNELKTALAFLPVELIHSARLKTVWISTHDGIVERDQYDQNQRIVPVGGYAEYGLMVYNGDAKVFMHELIHNLDYVDGIDVDDFDYHAFSYGSAVPAQLYNSLLHFTFAKIPRASLPVNSSSGFHPPDFFDDYGHAGFVMNGYYAEEQAQIGYNQLYFPRPYLETDNPVLKKKWEWMHHYLFIKSRGLMDTQYWQDRQDRIKMDDDYWQRRRMQQNLSLNDPDKTELDMALTEDQMLVSAQNFIFTRQYAKAFHAFSELATNYPHRAGYREQADTLRPYAARYFENIDLCTPGMNVREDPLNLKGTRDYEKN